MATQVIERLIDDLDGGEANETVTFAWEGATYTIDLSTKNAAKLRKALDPYVAAGDITRPVRSTRIPVEDTRLGRAQIREWARRQGHFPDLAARGRIPTEVVAAYRTATGRKHL